MQAGGGHGDGGAAGHLSVQSARRDAVQRPEGGEDRGAAAVAGAAEQYHLVPSAVQRASLHCLQFAAGSAVQRASLHSLQRAAGSAVQRASLHSLKLAARTVVHASWRTSPKICHCLSDAAQCLAQCPGYAFRCLYVNPCRGLTSGCCSVRLCAFAFSDSSGSRCRFVCVHVFAGCSTRCPQSLVWRQCQGCVLTYGIICLVLDDLRSAAVSMIDQKPQQSYWKRI